MSFLVSLWLFIGGFLLALLSLYLFVSYVVALFALVFLYDSYAKINKNSDFFGSFKYMNRVGFINFWKWLGEVIFLLYYGFVNLPLTWKIIEHRASLYFIKQPFAKLPPTTEDDLK
jgi:hypothetical protein